MKFYLSSDINECSENTHDCDQTCVNVPGTFVCGCNSGYRLHSNEKLCIGMYVWKAQDVTATKHSKTCNRIYLCTE